MNISVEVSIQQLKMLELVRKTGNRNTQLQVICIDSKDTKGTWRRQHLKCAGGRRTRGRNRTIAYQLIRRPFLDISSQKV